MSRLWKANVNDQVPTVRSRQLGAELRRIRQRAGYSTIELARILGWASSRVSRLETGKRGTSEVHVANWLGVCRVTGAEFDEVISLCRRTRERSWVQTHEPLAHDTVRALLHLETTAARISEFEPWWVPSLLQTADYTRALFERSRLVAPSAMDQRVQAVQARQAIFRSEQPPACRFYLSEHLVCRPIGTTEAMREQLRRLVRVAALPCCTIRILPVEGEGPCTAFRLMEFADQPACVYLRYLTGSVFLDDIDPYRTHLAHFGQTALDPNESQKLLRTWADIYDMPGNPIENSIRRFSVGRSNQIHASCMRSSS
jgi:transcriptional regulator with XRE-family HTH domain